VCSCEHCNELLCPIKGKFRDCAQVSASQVGLCSMKLLRISIIMPSSDETIGTLIWNVCCRCRLVNACYVAAASLPVSCGMLYRFGVDPPLAHWYRIHAWIQSGYIFCIQVRTTLIVQYIQMLYIHLYACPQCTVLCCVEYKNLFIISLLSALWISSNVKNIFEICTWAEHTKYPDILNLNV
jgi:hypothetical protein